MTVSIIAGGVARRPVSTPRLAVARGLVGEFVFGVDQPTSIINHVDPDNPAIPVNQSVYQPGFATTGTSGFDLQVATPQTDATIIQVTRNASPMVGRIAAGKLFGFSTLGVWNDTATEYFALPARGQSNNFVFTALQAPIGGIAQGKVASGGAIASSTDAAPGGKPRAVGTIGVSNYTYCGTGDIAFAAIFAVELTDAEITANYASLKNWYANAAASRGVTVN